MFGKGNNNSRRKAKEMSLAADRATSLNQESEHHLFAVITEATPVKTDAITSKHIYRYRITPAKWSWAGIGNLPQVTQKNPAGPFYYAFSISELGNLADVYAYGVPLTDLPAGIAPKAIPLGTPVFCWGHKRTNGEFYYLIINTQAISGQCT